MGIRLIHVTQPVACKERTGECMRIHKPCRVGVRNVGARPPTPPNGDMRNNGYHINVASRDLPLAKVEEFRIGSLTKPCAMMGACTVATLQGVPCVCWAGWTRTRVLFSSGEGLHLRNQASL